MVRVLTTTKEEYQKMKAILKDNLGVDIIEPEHCHAVVMWSIEDIREYMPLGTVNNKLEEALEHIEDTLREDMIDRGWDTIETLKSDMRSAIKVDCRAKLPF